MAQPRRGLADTALSLGVDISPRIQRLYAPPAAWSHGYLWGADTVTIADGARFSPRTDRIHRANRLKGLECPAARSQATRSGQLADRGAGAQRSRAGRRQGVDRDRGVQRRPGRHAPCSGPTRRRSVRSRMRLTTTGSTSASRVSSLPPAVEAIERVPRIRVIARASADRRTARTRASGCCASSASTSTRRTTRGMNTAATDPLAGYDVHLQRREQLPGQQRRQRDSRGRGSPRSSRAAAATSAASRRARTS